MKRKSKRKKAPNKHQTRLRIGKYKRKNKKCLKMPKSLLFFILCSYPYARIYALCEKEVEKIKK